MKNHLNNGSNYPDPKKGLTEGVKADIFTNMNKKYEGREFGEHDLKQVQESLKAEGKNPNDYETVIKDMQDYANKTGGAIGGKVGEQEGGMKMAA